MIQNIQIEICTGSIEDVKTVSSIEEVDRIELNSALELDGLTPSLATFLEARKLFKKEIICMSRPRSGNFCYTDDEKKIILQDAEILLKNSADGIVFGALNADGSVDLPFAQTMCTLIHSYHKTAVFHKAFDTCTSPDTELENLSGIGIDRILTSGAQPNAELGADKLRKWIAKDFVEILPGGGIRAQNVGKILEKTHCTMLHTSASNKSGDHYETSRDQINALLRQIDLYMRSLAKKRMTREDIEMLVNDRYQ